MFSDKTIHTTQKMQGDWYTTLPLVMEYTLALRTFRLLIDEHKTSLRHQWRPKSLICNSNIHKQSQITKRVSHF